MYVHHQPSPSDIDPDLSIIEAYVAWRFAYARACRHDKISPKAAFARFSSDNPHVAAVNEAAVAYFALVKAVEPVPGYLSGGLLSDEEAREEGV